MEEEKILMSQKQLQTCQEMGRHIMILDKPLGSV